MQNVLSNGISKFSAIKCTTDSKVWRPTKTHDIEKNDSNDSHAYFHDNS